MMEVDSHMRMSDIKMMLKKIAKELEYREMSNNARWDDDLYEWETFELEKMEFGTTLLLEAMGVEV